MRSAPSKLVLAAVASAAAGTFALGLSGISGLSTRVDAAAAQHRDEVEQVRVLRDVLHRGDGCAPAAPRVSQRS